MDEEDPKVTKAILVVQETMTSFAKQSITELTSEVGKKLEVFLEAELLVNITKHVLVPQHQVLDKEEKDILLKKYKLREAQLPRIQISDPVARAALPRAAGATRRRRARASTAPGGRPAMA